MATIRKDKLKSDELTIGSGADNDKKIIFDQGANSPYIRLNNSDNDLYYSSDGTLGTETSMTAGGGGSDAFYTHTQGISSASWSINHGLGKRPSIIIIDSAGSEVEGDIVYDDNNNITVTFSGAFTGVAYLN